MPWAEKRKKIKKNEEELQENEPKNPESQVEKEKEQLKIVEFQGKIEKPIIDSKIRPCGKSIKYFY